tara:strand:- start:166 stop:387 length:222 start_codon:yes stop_codon:yes gene_type:complete
MKYDHFFIRDIGYTRYEDRIQNIFDSFVGSQATQRALDVQLEAEFRDTMAKGEFVSQYRAAWVKDGTYKLVEI